MLFYVVGSFAFAETFNTTISGKLVNNLNQPIANVSFGLSSYMEGAVDYNQVQQMTTSATGEFSFNFVWDTKYKQYVLSAGGDCVNLFLDVVYSNGTMTVTNRNTNEQLFNAQTKSIALGNVSDKINGRIRVNSDEKVSMEFIGIEPNTGGAGTGSGYQLELYSALMQNKQYEITLTSAEDTSRKWTGKFSSSSEACGTTVVTKTGASLVTSYCTTNCPVAEAQYNKVILRKGWNLVSLQQFSGSSDYPDCFKTNVKGYSAYIKSLSSYVSAVFPNGLGMTSDVIYKPKNFQEILQTELKMNTYFAKSPVVWFYLINDCTANGRKDYQSPSISELQTFAIQSGWNFVSIDPWMSGKNLKDIFSNCNVTGFNSWNSILQKWEYGSSSAAVTNLSQSTGILREGDLGKAFVVKVASSCYLSPTGQIVSPPALPE